MGRLSALPSLPRPWSCPLALPSSLWPACDTAASHVGSSLADRSSMASTSPQRRLQAIGSHLSAAPTAAEDDEQMPPEMVAAIEAQQAAQAQMTAVVKIFVRSVDTSYTSPWQKMEAATGTGSGFSIGNNLILTNAHVVYNGVSVRVQRPYAPPPNQFAG